MTLSLLLGTDMSQGRLMLDFSRAMIWVTLPKPPASDNLSMEEVGWTMVDKAGTETDDGLALPCKKTRKVPL